MKKIRMMKPRKYRHEEGFHAMKSCSLIFTALMVSLSMLMVMLGFVIKVKSSIKDGDPQTPDRQIMHDISLVLIAVGLGVSVLNMLFHSLVRTEHIFFLTLAIMFVMALVCCEFIILIKPKLVSQFLVHQSLFVGSYAKDDILFDEEGRIIFPTSKTGIRWSFVQFAFKCCGISGPSDYDSMVEADMKLTSSNGLLEQMRLPMSCCKLDVDFKFFTKQVVSKRAVKRCLINDPTAYHEQGCFGINWKEMNFMTYIVAIFVIFTTITHIIQLIIFSTLIVKRSKFRRR